MQLLSENGDASRVVMATRTSLIVLIFAAYIGGAAALHACWQYSFLLALLAAPFGGSLAALSMALLLYLRNLDGKSRPLGSAEDRPHRTVGQTN